MANLLTTDVFQYYLDTSDAAEPVYTRVTEDSSFNPSADKTTYSPSYKDRKVQPEYVVGKKIAVEYDIDILDDQALQDWFRAHEWDDNVPTRLVRVDRSSGSEAERPAIMAAFVMNENPIDGAAGEALKATGTLTMTDADWTTGTFNESTKAFTAASGE